MEFKQKNISLVHNKLLSVIIRINDIIEKDPSKTELLADTLFLTTKHSEKLIYIKEILAETERLSGQQEVESIFKHFLVDADLFCNEAHELLKKHFS